MTLDLNKCLKQIKYNVGNFAGNLDDKMSLYKYNRSLYNTLEQDELSAEVYTWKVRERI